MPASDSGCDPAHRGEVPYAGAGFWDRFFRQRKDSEPDYVAEESGQTVHFFSEAYLRDLLAGWRELHVEPVQIRRGETGEPFKQVWRGIACD